MGTEHILENLIHIPRLFGAGKLSMYELLKQSGYFELDDQVTESTIRDVLARHPECVDEWLSYSEDKRVDSGWYIKQEGVCYRVGYFSPDSGESSEASYVDRMDACAAFIKHELEDLCTAHSSD